MYSETQFLKYIDCIQALYLGTMVCKVQKVSKLVTCDTLGAASHAASMAARAVGGGACDLNVVHVTLCFEFSFFNFLSHFCFCYKVSRPVEASRY